MFLVNLNPRFRQELVCHFLQANGHQAAPFDPKLTYHETSTILVTDNVLNRPSSCEFIREIWLVEETATLALPLPANVLGVLCNDTGLDELTHCISEVANHQRYIGQSIFRLLTSPVSTLALGDAELRKLTRREREVFDLIRLGHSLRAIAERLFISAHTAENHRANIQRKLSLSGRLSLVRYAALSSLPLK